MLRWNAGGAVVFVRGKDGSNYKTWTAGAINTNPVVVTVRSVQSALDSAVKINIGNTPQSLSVDYAGTPAIASDAANDLYVGNRVEANSSLNGTVYYQAWFPRVLSDSQYLAAYRRIQRILAARGVTV